jgi:hypothetical protein
VDGSAISEDDFTRLCGVARGTRRDWATEGLVSPVASPYSLLQLHEVVAYVQLRETLDAGARIAWTQLRDGLRQATVRRPCEAIIDLHTLRAEWVLNGHQITAVARTGHPIRLVDFSGRLDVAVEGFELAASARKQSTDDLAARRTQRGRGGPSPPSRASE